MTTDYLTASTDESSDSALACAIRDEGDAALQSIRGFVETEPFQRLLDELWALPPDERPEFVSSTILNTEQRRLRGIVVPDGMVIQRSWFADGRPPLFCITRQLRAGLLWKKVTFTFDNPM